MPSFDLATAPGVHRFGGRIANWYLIDDAGELTLVDAGFPADWSRLEGAVAALGRSLEALRAVVLTHAHDDHIGVAQPVAEHVGAPVMVHEADEALARREETGEVTGMLPYLWRPTTLAFLVHFVRRRGPWPRPILEPVTYDGAAPLDVPGRPVPVHTPGHTAGHCALHLPDRGVVFSGDALVTRDVLTGAKGPRLSPDPFNDDSEEAARSLDRIRELEADVLLPGHGEPYRGGPAKAVEIARSRL